MGSTILFDPLKSYCAEWKKIYPDYKRHLDFFCPTTCAQCGAPATNRCSACQKVAYCSGKCQKLNWKTHKSKCCPYKLVTDPKNPEIGRFVIASRDIEPGEIIMEEPPITAGPRQFTGIVCLGCHRQRPQEDMSMAVTITDRLRFMLLCTPPMNKIETISII